MKVWGTTPDEMARGYPCDRLVPGHNEAYFRGVTIGAGAEAVFPWLCQLKAAPYSYDWLDNFGRPSPRTLTPGLDRLEAGQRFMTLFDLAEFERPVHITLRLRDGLLLPPSAVSYVIAPAGPGASRLLVKIVVRYTPLLHAVPRRLTPWFDWIMMRRQLLTLKGLAERA